MNEEDKLIEEQFKKLPENVQSALNAVPWKSSVKEIALLNNLSLEKVAAVERETMFILYGFENPDDYVANLMREVSLDEAAADAIATAVNEKIIKTLTLELENPPKSVIHNEMVPAPVSVPEVAPQNLPMIEEGEKVHDVPHIEQPANVPIQKPEAEKPKIAVPNYKYDKGKDPYREPLV